jgi:hypothetical protein
MFFSFDPFNTKLICFVFGLVYDAVNDVVNAFLKLIEVAEVCDLVTILGNGSIGGSIGRRLRRLGKLKLNEVVIRNVALESLYIP